ncbi:hypothetical protein HELRODRAFT_185477 [Helobdella robusta]|uniref:Annexin n=1 Tax=Helobdella robusta TaxID=6412 RepID=T1FMV4_HELRO|nr:hypothetical protein HELRODRAFT_185477 [Helobdella robusta]ESO06772.1 hypothetical protein HELRODRAFT_185477 [Helobdella robusta]
MATVIPNPHFNSEEAAKKLRAAMKGAGADEKIIIDVLVSHDNAQRQEIIDVYKTLFGRDLIKDLKAELGGYFESTVVALMTPKYEFLAKDLARAMKGAGTDETALIQILCAHMNKDLIEIKSAYKKLTGRELESDIIEDTSGHIKHLLVAQSNAFREDEGPVDYDRVEKDVDEINKAAKKKFGADAETFNAILSSRSYNQLYATFERYKEKYGEDIEDTIKKETGGNLRDGLLTIVQYTKDPSLFFAKCLYKSMKGAGTDDRTLIRIIVTRSEDDLASIAGAFYAMYEQPLSDYISSDCSGDYKRLLLAILGNI